MAESHEYEIEYFQSISNWKKKEDVIRFLKMYQWDVKYALQGFFDMLDQDTENQESPKIERLLSHDIDPQPNYSPTEHSFAPLTTNENPSVRWREPSASNHASRPLFNSMDPQRSNQSSHQTVNMSNRTSFLEQVDETTVSDVKKIPGLFLDKTKFDKNKQELIRYIDASIIGRNLQTDTPWGRHTVIYADYTASGRCLAFIEDYMRDNVLPFYANTHSENNVCAKRTTKYREGARLLIKRYVNGNDDDVIIFTGAGSTSAINQLVNVLHLKDEHVRDQTVVFISTYEHHSNILPWTETGVQFERIPNTPEGLLDQKALEERLKHYRNKTSKRIICTFSAASNVTGILTDVNPISTLVHQYNGLIFWDYAAGAPYLHIDMNPSKTAYKDAIFISTHKFVGGPGTPGLLIAKKQLFQNAVPSNPGGGTVNFVTREQIEYSSDIETREEGGTPNILGAIRSGLVFHLKGSVGTDYIEARENELVKKFFDRFRNNSNLKVLGSPTAERLAIFSFLIHVPAFDNYLHHNFICVLLNDLFGIQVRSGCSCAGPYVLELLGITDEQAAIYTQFVTEDKKNKVKPISPNALMKPGFTRFNLSYFISDEEVNYILDALEFISHEGWRFLALYTYNTVKATWRPRHMPSESPAITSLDSLQMITFGADGIQVRHEERRMIQPAELLTSTSNDPIERARTIVSNIPTYVNATVEFQIDPPLNIAAEYQDYVWFVTPREVILKLLNEYQESRQHNRIRVPFGPRNPRDK